MRVPLHRLRVRRAMTALALILWTTACAMSRDETSVLTADMPLHLEDHLDAATVTGSALPATVPATVEWQFDRPQSEWHATSLWNPPYGRAPTLTRTADALRVTLTERLTVLPNPGLRGAIHVGVAAWNRAEWADVVIRARADSTSSINFMRLAFNLREGRGTSTPANSPFQFPGQQSPIVRDGNVHTYQLRVNQGSQTFKGPGGSSSSCLDLPANRAASTFCLSA